MKNASFATHTIRFISPKLVKFFIFIQAGFRIITSQEKEQKLTGTEPDIIRQIHEIRYAETNPYVTTGGHFSQLYVRNLGIFLNALLDPRIPSSKQDWENRQSIALRTVALDLNVFSKAKKTYTTIVPLARNIYSAMNIYTEPSDSLFGILYTLCALQDETFIPSVFPASRPKHTQRHGLQTKEAAQTLLQRYKQPLIALLTEYKTKVINPKNGLIRTDIHLASARDGIKRESAFYDNVICWATMRFANKLGLINSSDTELLSWKQNILNAFWDENEGIFLDDFSEIAKQEKRFCADSLIVTSSGFFDLKNKDDVKKLHEIVSYIQKQALDKPLPLRYSKTNQLDRLYWAVRIGAPAYMGTTIWSHWGMEYIKALILLGKKSQAKQHLAVYKNTIEQFGGYPELYDEYGNIYTTPLYKGVLHNSWVINYEQATMLLDSI